MYYRTFVYKNQDAEGGVWGILRCAAPLPHYPHCTSGHHSLLSFLFQFVPLVTREIVMERDFQPEAPLLTCCLDQHDF